MPMRRWMGMAALSAAMLTGQELVVDRGLPRVNQNNEAGSAARSNIRWTLYNQGFAGDDFTVGKAGEKWVIQTVRVWAVPGAYESDPATLGDVYQDVRLYVGGPDENLSPVVTGRLKRGSNAVEGADVTITEAAGAPRYENFGAELKIYQVEFRNVKLVVDGGVRYRFGAWGLGRVIGEKGEVYPWFTHGSNAVQGETPVYGTDGKLLLFDTAGRYAREFDPAGAAWNKGSDLNVQIWADRQ
ncbi:MAG TPA: hypothetical protein VFQ91_25565 [Bryobacteraceae bacterium]|nr:hypothetical protein [Bryobacteraceae bacterium]